MNDRQPPAVTALQDKWSARNSDTPVMGVDVAIALAQTLIRSKRKIYNDARRAGKTPQEALAIAMSAV